MASFVLVHGAWHGAWCWQRVARMLERNGHQVFAPTLTGLCERSHLLTPAVDLNTHISDVANDIKWKELKDIVLVGHSYGGMVISGVAETMEQAIASFVMLDAFMPENDQSVIDLWPAPMREGLLAAERGGATTIPPRAAALFKVNEKDCAWVDAQCTPQPIKCFLQKLPLTGARERIARKTYIRAAGYENPYFNAGLASARAKKWRTYEVPCGHDVMLDMPERLTEILQDVA
ncbi:MAG: alpha/beta hydrolase [Hyphomicrobiales bacterium]|nr:alpha/beta hydrolase [Hyphomicrobiales bacterium]MDE2286490.1 alpha/beta hydrolase [Hyphomicrobiales bacterium]